MPGVSDPLAALRAAVALAPCPGLVLDEEGHVVTVNAAATAAWHNDGARLQAAFLRLDPACPPTARTALSVGEPLAFQVCGPLPAVVWLHLAPTACEPCAAFAGVVLPEPASVLARDVARRLALAAEGLGFGLWERDLTDGSSRWDAGVYRLLGTDSTDPRPLADIRAAALGAAEQARLDALYERAVHTGRSVSHEMRIRLPDGGERWLALRATAQADVVGRPQRVLGVCWDITERQAANRALAGLAARLQLATEAAGVGVWEWDIAGARYCWDQEWCRIHGLDQAARSGAMDEWLALLHPDDRARAANRMQAVVARDEDYDDSFRIVRRSDGVVRRIHARGRIFRDADGRPLRMVGADWDVTERAEAESAARTAGLRLSFAAEVVGLGVWEYHPATRRAIWDERMYELVTGRRSGVEPRQAWEAAVDPADLARLRREMRRALLTGAAYDVDVRVRHADGQQRWLAGRGYSVASEDGLRMIGLQWDITDRKLAENALRAKDTAERASRAKSEFLSRMSHELRTPLNAVLGFAQLIEQDRLDPPTPGQRARLEHIVNAGRHLLTVIGDVLEMARAEAAAERLVLEAVPLRALVDEALDLLRPPADAAGVRLLAEVPGGCVVQADRLRLKQVLINLLSNAVKYNRAGGQVRVWIDRPTDCADCLVICVRDTGTGLTALQLDQLFQPFNRLGREGAAIEGSGLGLVIVQRMVGEMGGALDVASEPGVGSEFRVRLNRAGS
ncbi:sensor histidine kinase [Derxia lacustris]|uniref:sensor histidine kinase n=1 Tax=Derxia lacustris TaxID=764842 RepID=UPI000A172A00|nr:HAMP domain-containing sensor histidine kinase [Derxia lacustris]